MAAVDDAALAEGVDRLRQGMALLAVVKGPSALLGHRFTVVLARQVIAGGF